MKLKNRKVITIDENGFVDLKQFADIIDISKIEWYEITGHKEEGVLTIHFYDKEYRSVKPFPLDENKENSEDT